MSATRCGSPCGPKRFSSRRLRGNRRSARRSPSGPACPTCARLGLGPGGEDPRGVRLVASLQPDRAVLGRSRRHAASRATPRDCRTARACRARGRRDRRGRRGRRPARCRPAACPSRRLELRRSPSDTEMRVLSMCIVVGEHDALVGHDVLVERVVGVDRAARRAAAHALAAADAEVELVVRLLPLVGTDEPARLGLGVGPGREHARRRRRR